MTGLASRSSPPTLTLTGAADQLVAGAAELRATGLLGPAGQGGSLSLRLDDGRVALLAEAATPDRVREQVRAASLRDASSAGAPFGLHAAVHAASAPGAVIVARPVALAALGLGGITVARCLLALPCAELERLPPGASLSAALGPLIAPEVRAVLFGRFGAVVWGEDLAQAVASLEQLDHAARATLGALSGAAVAGGRSGAALSEREVSHWQDALVAEGLSPGGTCADCNACSNGHRPAPADASSPRSGEQAALDAAVDHLLRT